MRRVKALMIARLLLAWLWMLLWLTAAPGMHARVVHSGGSAPVVASTDGQSDQRGHDFASLHFRAMRALRRFGFQSTPTNPLLAICSFDARTGRQQDAAGSLSTSTSSHELASGWQFLLRAAPSPRAPSFVS